MLVFYQWGYAKCKIGFESVAQTADRKTGCKAIEFIEKRVWIPQSGTLVQHDKMFFVFQVCYDYCYSFASDFF